MKKIGQGWQYTVYDLENGKVIKKFHSWIRAYYVIFMEIFPFNNDSFFEIPAFIKDMRRKADASFEILKKINIPSEWLSNPKFINRYDFEQDKVVPLHDVFETLDTEGINKIIDKFIEFNKKLMELGVLDKSFNITRNYGLDKNNEIVLIDIGELYNDKELINKQFKDRALDKDYVSGRIKDEKSKNYYIREMDKNFYKY